MSPALCRAVRQISNDAQGSETFFMHFITSITTGLNVILAVTSITGREKRMMTESLDGAAMITSGY